MTNPSSSPFKHLVMLVGSILLTGCATYEPRQDTETNIQSICLNEYGIMKTDPNYYQCRASVLQWAHREANKDFGPKVYNNFMQTEVLINRWY